MSKTHISRLLLVASLFLLPTSLQVFAAEKSIETKIVMTHAEKININQANNQQLAAIKGIGTKKAQAIIDYRDANGDFVSLEELVKVKGIGKSTLTKITPFVSL
ncbi:ComEA family DNA-binding protein [Psychromonas hadalis]|uniref:ComEA family DNA-binding protein n=1 Tax=Psychromonas hadalis TaxID=211669 RepID=UPI0003B4E09D|nr:helix-hairpin-helix domain-containing protein [Psychromonas hadalis]